MTDATHTTTGADPLPADELSRGDQVKVLVGMRRKQLRSATFLRLGDDRRSIIVRVRMLRGGQINTGNTRVPLADVYEPKLAPPRAAARHRRSTRVEHTVRVDRDSASAEQRPVNTGRPGRGVRPTTPAICRVDGCQAVVASVCLCSQHYQRYVACCRPDMDRWRDAGAPTYTEWLKRRRKEQAASIDVSEDLVLSPQVDVDAIDPTD